MRDTRYRIAAVAGLVISAAAVWFVVQTIDVAAAGEAIGRANLVPLVAILGVVAVQALLRAWRWSILIPARTDGTKVAAIRLLPPMLVGYLGNAVLPARLGEPMRALIAARRERIAITEALGSVLVERLIDIAMLAIVAFLAAVMIGAPGWILQVLGITAAAGVAGFAILVVVGLDPLLRIADRLGLAKRSQIREVAARFVATLGGRSRRGALVAAAGISVVTWFLDATSFWLAAQSVGAEVPYIGAMVVSGIAVLGTAVPSAPGYVGTFELAAAGTAGALGASNAPALAMAVVVHVMTLVPLALAGAASLVGMGANLGDVARAADVQRNA